MKHHQLAKQCVQHNVELTVVVYTQHRYPIPSGNSQDGRSRITRYFRFVSKDSLIAINNYISTLELIELSQVSTSLHLNDPIPILELQIDGGACLICGKLRHDQKSCDLTAIRNTN